MRACRNLPDFRPILDEAFEIFGDAIENVVAVPQYRAAANIATGWKNANLLSEMTRFLRRRVGMAEIALSDTGLSPSGVETDVRAICFCSSLGVSRPIVLQI